LEHRPDDTLVNELRLGNPTAFESLYYRYKDDVFSLCLNLTNNQALAEDITHDAFLRMRDHIRTLRDVSVFRSWLFAIARNLTYKTLRKNRSNPLSHEEDLWDDSSQHVELEREEIRTSVLAAIRSLKLEYREVIVLREFQQLSYAEIAQITGDSESSVKSRLFKARKALAARLAPLFR